MRREQLKDCIDDALSGIGENPWLLRQVLARAEREEHTPVRKKISFGTVLAVILILALMSAGIAAVTRWNVLDFLKEWGKEAPYITTQVQQEAETEGARMRVDSVVYDGETLAFDWTLENKHPEVPVWCWVEEFTVNGNDVIDYDTGEHSQERWLPNDGEPEGIARWGDCFQLSGEIAGEETAHVIMKVNIYRPVRPVALLETEDGFGEELERKIAGGYYAIPVYSDGTDVYLDGFFVPEEDRNACPEGWVIAVSGCPPEDDLMGGMTVETLEISFDAEKTAPVEGMTELQTQEIYENAYCTAVFERADVSDLGLRLTLRIRPGEGSSLPEHSWLLTDGEGRSLEGKGSNYFTLKKEESPSPDHEGETVWQYEWPRIRPDDLPDTFALCCKLKNGEELFFPVKVR